MQDTSAGQSNTPYVIVVGNEKGGTGKSTTAMHLAVALMRLGFNVGALDLDARQASLTRYLDNRARYVEEHGVALSTPLHRKVERSQAATLAEAEADERARLNQALREFAACSFVVIDTPGSDSQLSRMAHEHADTLVTPINDSFLDIDVLAQIDRRQREVLAPSAYSQLVWEQNNRRVIAGRAPIDWIVMRNRLTHLDARNKREIAGLLEQLARRIGFRLAAGFGERVVFRELFLRGLTLLDLPEVEGDLPPNPSHMAARQEIKHLLQTIGLREADPAEAGTPQAVAR